MNNKRIEELEKMSVEQLKKELVDVGQAAHMEKIWMFGSNDKEAESIHYQNMEVLRAEYRYIDNLVLIKTKK